MRVTTKPGVDFMVITPALVRMFDCLVKWPNTEDLPPELVITSGSDGAHVVNSKHYRGEAIDVRSHAFPSHASKARFRAALEHSLGQKFRVLLEGAGTTAEHFHCQVRKGASYP